MDTDELHAQLREANARLLQTKQGERYAEAIVKQRQSELTYARNEYGRSSRLSNEGHVSVERLDLDRNALTTAEAALQAANVQVLEAQAAAKGWTDARMAEISAAAGEAAEGEAAATAE